MCATQFGELRRNYETIEASGLSIIGLALEETSAADTKKFVPSMGGEPPFPLVSDVERVQTKGFEQTTSYLIDADGVVRQVYPMLTYARGSMRAMLRDVERVLADG